jgi:hypothetical protein
VGSAERAQPRGREPDQGCTAAPHLSPLDFVQISSGVKPAFVAWG